MTKQHSQIKKEREEFAFLMEKAKAESQLRSVLERINKDESVEKEKKVAESNLEKELVENIDEIRDEERRLRDQKLENTVSYESNDAQKQNAPNTGGGPQEDLYKHDAHYKADEYLPNDAKGQQSQNASDIGKTEIDRLVEKTRDIYRRN